MSDLLLGAFLGLTVVKLIQTPLTAALVSMNHEHTYNTGDILTSLFAVILWGTLAMLTYIGVLG